MKPQSLSIGLKPQVFSVLFGVTLVLPVDKLQSSVVSAPGFTLSSHENALQLEEHDSLLSILKGEWVIVKYSMDREPGMSAEIAAEWVGKKAFISKTISFDYKQIQFYGQYFQEKSKYMFESIPILKIVSDTFLTREEFFIYTRTEPEVLSLAGDSIRIVETNFRLLPFWTLVIDSRNRFLTLWDGVWFVFERINHIQRTKKKQ